MDHVFSIAPNTNNFSPASITGKDIEVSLPTLVAPNNNTFGGGFSNPSNSSYGTTVDVVSDFYWTYSKTKEARQEVPKIILTEKRLKVNALVSQLKYSYGVAKQNISSAFKKLPDEFKSFIPSFISGETVENIENKLSNFAPETLDNNSLFDSNPNNYLNPYKNLYITEPTGWQFILPYFEDKTNSQVNTFSKDSSNPFVGLLSKAASFATDIAETVSMLSQPTQISFVEKSKFFNYSEEGDEIQCTFPLINTGSVTFEDVVRNWELLFLLLYNNKPSRKSVSIIEPPALYQVEIPGVRFFPFCYISQIEVAFQGSRRELVFDLSYIGNKSLEALTKATLTPFFEGDATLNNFLNGTFNKTGPELGFSMASKPQKITTIIPDAYQISISLKSLISESKNFMYSVLDQKRAVTTRTINSLVPESPILGK